jgi:hypothetical protein
MHPQHDCGGGHASPSAKKTRFHIKVGSPVVLELQAFDQGGHPCLADAERRGLPARFNSGTADGWFAAWLETAQTETVVDTALVENLGGNVHVLTLQPVETAGHFKLVVEVQSATTSTEGGVSESITYDVDASPSVADPALSAVEVYLDSHDVSNGFEEPRFTKAVDAAGEVRGIVCLRIVDKFGNLHHKGNEPGPSSDHLEQCQRNEIVCTIQNSSVSSEHEPHVTQLHEELPLLVSCSSGGQKRLRNFLPARIGDKRLSNVEGELGLGLQMLPFLLPSNGIGTFTIQASLNGEEMGNSPWVVHIDAPEVFSPQREDKDAKVDAPTLLMTSSSSPRMHQETMAAEEKSGVIALPLQQQNRSERDGRLRDAVAIELEKQRRAREHKKKELEEKAVRIAKIKATRKEEAERVRREALQKKRAEAEDASRTQQIHADKTRREQEQVDKRHKIMQLLRSEEVTRRRAAKALAKATKDSRAKLEEEAFNKSRKRTGGGFIVDFKTK